MIRHRYFRPWSRCLLLTGRYSGSQRQPENSQSSHHDPCTDPIHHARPYTECHGPTQGKESTEKLIWQAKASTVRTCGTTEKHFAGCSKRPFSKAAASEEERRTLRYVEPLSEARTKLTDFFSILLGPPIHCNAHPDLLHFREWTYDRHTSSSSGCSNRSSSSSVVCLVDLVHLVFPGLSGLPG